MRYAVVEDLPNKVKVAYPKEAKRVVTKMLIYNLICQGTNYIECEVERST